jgi:8-oxo-dGTP pyrophosphatase MutT (NUDIX family)
MIPEATLERIERRLARLLAHPPAPLVAFLVDEAIAGWLTADRAARLAHFPDVFRMNRGALAFVPGLDRPSARTEALTAVTVQLAREGALTAWRNERYAIGAAFDAPPWFEIERAAARYFGVSTYAAHVNGLVRGAAQPSMWIARRSAGKAIDPGMLDNLVGGGIAAGATAAGTVIKEAWEEAGIAEDIAREAKPAATLTVFREQPDGIQRETIYAHDLWLSSEFSPANQDGEAVEHRCVAFDEAARLIAEDDGRDAVTADASLVALDCLFRHGAIPSASACYATLARLGRADL